MRILIHGINYAPEWTGVGRYTGEMAAWLAARGHAVRVVTAPPYYPDWKVAEGYSAWRYRRERRDGVEVWRCPLWVPSRPTGATRILHLASFAATGLPVLHLQKRWGPQVVMGVAPSLLSAFGTLALARRSGARSWLHVQDFELDAAFALGILSRPAWRTRMEAVERRLLGRFDRVSTLSERMRERLLAKGVEKDAAVRFPNWVDPEAIRPLPDPAPCRRALGLPATGRVALYAGTMAEKQGLDLLIEAARRLKDRPDLWIVLAGKGSARDRLVRAAADLPNVRFLPLQPPEDLNALLNAADLHLLPQRPGAADLVMPSKLGAMLASGRPTVATAAPGTEVHDVLRECGVVVPPGRPEVLADAIARLSDDPARCAALGAAAREYAETHLGRDPILGALEESLAQLVETPPPLCYDPGGSRRP